MFQERVVGFRKLQQGPDLPGSNSQRRETSQLPSDLQALADRWSARADTWDAEIQAPEHYTAETYPRFLAVENAILEQLPHMQAGIDIGCGTGEASRPLAAKVDTLYLLDIAPRMVEEAGRKFPYATTITASATAIPLPSASMDIAISRGIVVSHVGPAHSGEFLDEITRIVREGGIVLFDFLNNIEINPSVVSAPKATFTNEEMLSELEKRGFVGISFDGDDQTREVRVAAIRGKEQEVNA